MTEAMTATIFNVFVFLFILAWIYGRRRKRANREAAIEAKYQMALSERMYEMASKDLEQYMQPVGCFEYRGVNF